MGDRSTITITSRDWETPVSFYGHWSGDTNLKAVLAVIERTDRIGDAAYLTAQIFYEFARLGGYDGGLGFGIVSGEMVETENPPVFVDADSGKVLVGCVVCSEPQDCDTWREELGMCLKDSNDYFAQDNE
jgi:hypothetical protein